MDKDSQPISKLNFEVNKVNVNLYLSKLFLKYHNGFFKQLNDYIKTQTQLQQCENDANARLEAELQYGNQLIKRLRLDLSTLKNYNIEANKLLQLDKQNEVEYIEEIEKGKKKYQNAWIKCKQNYESHPVVQEWVEITDRVEKIKNNTKEVCNKTNFTINNINKKRNTFNQLEQTRVKELAYYMVHERKNILKLNADKQSEIDKSTAILQDLYKQRQDNLMCQGFHKNPVKEFSLLSTLNISASLEIPKLELPNSDFKRDMQPSRSYVASSKINKKSGVNDSFATSYMKFFSYKNNILDDNKKKAEDRKFINILEDICITKNAANDIVRNAAPKSFLMTDTKHLSVPKKTSKITFESNQNDSENNQLVEYSNLTPQEIIISPPNQFLDVSLRIDNTCSVIRCSPSAMTVLVKQDESQKKRVSFEIPPEESLTSVTEGTVEDINMTDDILQTDASEANNLNLSCSNDSYTNIRERYLKKNNLDTSPKFVFTKNTLTTLNNEQTISSRFFASNTKPTIDEISKQEVQSSAIETSPTQSIIINKSPEIEENIAENNESIDDISKDNGNKEHKANLPNQELQVNPVEEPYNMSIITTGLDDTDISHCIDTSLLLSPKADMPVEENADENMPQPSNFFTGLRKTGLSFFGEATPVAKPDSVTETSQNNFSFNFGSNKKSSELFKMFK